MVQLTTLIREPEEWVCIWPVPTPGGHPISRHGLAPPALLWTAQSVLLQGSRQKRRINRLLAFPETLEGLPGA